MKQSIFECVSEWAPFLVSVAYDIKANDLGPAFLEVAYESDCGFRIMNFFGFETFLEPEKYLPNAVTLQPISFAAAAGSFAGAEIKFKLVPSMTQAMILKI